MAGCAGREGTPSDEHGFGKVTAEDRAGLIEMVESDELAELLSLRENVRVWVAGIGVEFTFLGGPVLVVSAR